MENSFYNLFKKFPLDILVDHEGLTLQNEDEVLNVTVCHNDQFSVRYFTLDKTIARRTLKNCPEVLDSWRERVEGLKSTGNYVDVPYLEGKFDKDMTELICVYLGNRIVENKLKTETLLN